MSRNLYFTNNIIQFSVKTCVEVKPLKKFVLQVLVSLLALLSHTNRRNYTTYLIQTCQCDKMYTGMSVAFFHNTMKTTLVQITVDVPYPKTFEYRQETSNVSTAVARAMKQVRKDLSGKRIKEYRIKSITL